MFLLLIIQDLVKVVHPNRNKTTTEGWRYDYSDGFMQSP